VTGPRDRFVDSLTPPSPRRSKSVFPVVLKGMVENMVHKSDAGLVKVGLRSKWM